jgi:hypothetical protein
MKWAKCVRGVLAGVAGRFEVRDGRELEVGGLKIDTVAAATILLLPVAT